MERTALNALSLMRLRDSCSRAEETHAMDLNYMLKREQYELHLATTSQSMSARTAHRAFAKAYGLAIAASGFPHSINKPGGAYHFVNEARIVEHRPLQDWENEGGSLSNPKHKPN
ncbi:hypothetical protein ACLBWH_17980 [Sphingomonas sp. M6A6_1c]